MRVTSSCLRARRVGTQKKPQRQWNDKKNVELFFFKFFGGGGGDSIEAANEPRQKCASFIFLRRVHLKNPELFHDGKGYIIPAKWKCCNNFLSLFFISFHFIFYFVKNPSSCYGENVKRSIVYLRRHNHYDCFIHTRIEREKPVGSAQFRSCSERKCLVRFIDTSR